MVSKGLKYTIHNYEGSLYCRFCPRLGPGDEEYFVSTIIAKLPACWVILHAFVLVC